MKAVLALGLLFAIGIGAYFLFGASNETPTAAGDPEPAVVEEPLEETAEDATEEAEEVLDEATTAVEELKEDAETVVEEMKTEVEEAVTEAVEAEVESVTEQADVAAEAVKNQVEEAVEATTDKVQNAIENALGSQTDGQSGGAVEPTEEQLAADAEANLEMDAIGEITSEQLDTALSVDSFDGLLIREAMKAMDLGALAETSLESLIASGEQKPDHLQDIIPQIRELLGL